MADRETAPRVLLLTHSYAPEATPPARRWEAIVRGLVAEGWSVTVLAPGAPDHAARSERGEHGETVLRTRSRRAEAGGRNARFADAVIHSIQSIPLGLAATRPDVVVATVPALPTVVAGRALAVLRRLPLVLEMRDAWPDLARDAGLRSGPLGRLMERIVGGAQRRADLVVTVTAGFAETLRARGIACVETLGNGVALDAIPALPPRDRRPGDELHVLYLGNHGESQGLERLVEAAARLRSRAPGVRVRMVGSGTRREELLALNRRRGEPVEMLDAVHGQAAREHYAWADTVMVCLRPDWASFLHTVPSKTYELLSIGRHVTAQVQGEAAAVVEAAGGGDVVGPTVDDLVAHLEALWADPASTRTTGAARGWVASHADLSTIGHRYAELLSRTVLRRRGRSSRPRI
ncbi:glycosyltransferase family 4 protein [Micrococcus lylae]|uniref:glycosyltransferase family 4 protein n=1 Tax=Micrococcus lylae TaxID=1273 RepID=UPI003EBF374B